MQRLSRRAFLTGAAGAGITIGAAGALAACAGAGSGTGSSGLAPALRLPPAQGLTWPVTTANQPIAGGLTAGRGATLRVLSWPSYTSPAVLSRFASANQCSVELPAHPPPPALRRWRRGGPRYDVVLGANVTMLADLAAGQLIQPLNHTYLPNRRNVWPVLQSPYYDQGARYTVPCGVYTTGIAWRKDKVAQSPYAMAVGWDFAWLPRYRDRVAILADYREGIGLGLLRIGSVNLNTADPADLNQAQQVLTELTGRRASRIDGAAAESLGSGRTWIHQARSFDIAALSHQLPPGLPAEALGYWFPPSGYGPVSCETGAVARGSRNPVLAHLFLNSLLSLDNALANAGSNGRTPPLNAATPSVLIRQVVVPGPLASTVSLPETLRRGLVELPLPDPATGLWLRAWKGVSGMA